MYFPDGNTFGRFKLVLGRVTFALSRVVSWNRTFDTARVRGGSTTSSLLMPASSFSSLEVGGVGSITVNIGVASTGDSFWANSESV